MKWKADSRDEPASCATLVQELLTAFQLQSKAEARREKRQLRTGRENESLLCGRCDAVAQITLFNTRRTSLAFLAVSPRARLFTEILGGTSFLQCRAQLVAKEDEFIAVLTPTDTDKMVSSPLLSAWWLHRCGVSICIDVAKLGDEVDLRQLKYANIVALQGGEHLSALQIEDISLHAMHDLSLSSKTFNALVAKLCNLTNLRTLRLRDFSVGHAEALRSLPHVEELHVQGSMGRLDVGQLRAAASLKKLYVASNELLNITGLLQCPSLQVLSVHSSSLRNAASVLEATNLSKLVIIGASLSELPEVGDNSLLENVSLPWCKRLESLAQLANCTALSKVVVNGSGLRSLNGLAQCPVLKEIDCSNCENLSDLSPLSGAPQLQTITAPGSAITSIEGLARCPFLRELDVSWCYSLSDLSPLTAAPRLRVVRAACSGARNITGLNKCPLLEYVNFSHCDHLESLTPLAGAPALRKVHAKGSSIRTAAGLDMCGALEELDVSKCPHLNCESETFLNLSLRSTQSQYHLKLSKVF